MFTPISWPRSVRVIAGLLLASMGSGKAPLQAQAPQTFNACYVPSVGAIYLIGLTGLPSSCLATTHVAVSWTQDGGGLADLSVTTPKLADGAVVAIKLANGAVTTDKLAPGAVTAPKLAFDPATQPELDAAVSGLGNPGTINTASNPVDWTRLKGVPAGFADGTDANSGGTITGATTGGGLELSGTTLGLADNSINSQRVADHSLTTDDFSPLAGTLQWDIPSVAPGTCAQQTFPSLGANIDGDPVLVMVDDNFPNGMVVRAVDAVPVDAIELVACNVTTAALDPVSVPFFYVVFNRP